MFVTKWWMRSLVGGASIVIPLAVLVLIAGSGSSLTTQRILLGFLIDVVVVLGLQMFMGLTGILSLGHVGFMAIGAYTAALLTTPPETKILFIPDAPHLILNANLGFVPATAVAVVLAMVVALVVGVVISRLSGLAASLATYGFLVAVVGVIVSLKTITLGARTFGGVPLYSTPAIALLIAGLFVFVGRLVRDSMLGLGLRASREDVTAASGSGVDVSASRLKSWILSGGVAATGGALYAHFVGSLSPTPFGLSRTLLYLTMAIVGGSTISGAVVGVTTVAAVIEGLRRFGGVNTFDAGGAELNVTVLTPVVLAVFILLVLKFLPRGILGAWELDEWIERSWRARRAAAID